MFIKQGDGVITGVVKTSEDLTDEQKKQAEKLVKEISEKKKEN